MRVSRLGTEAAGPIGAGGWSGTRSDSRQPPRCAPRFCRRMKRAITATRGAVACSSPHQTIAVRGVRLHANLQPLHCKMHCAPQLLGTLAMQSFASTCTRVSLWSNRAARSSSIPLPYTSVSHYILRSFQKNLGLAFTPHQSPCCRQGPTADRPPAAPSVIRSLYSRLHNVALAAHSRSFPASTESVNLQLSPAEVPTASGSR